MITAQKIIEEWKTSFKINKILIDVYENPSLSEMAKNFDKEKVRFFASAKKKKIYVWNGNLAVHWDVYHNATEIDFSAMGDYKEGNELEGIAKWNAGRYVMTEAHMLSWERSGSDVVKKFFKCDWSWADKYIVITPWLDKNRGKLLYGY